MGWTESPPLFCTRTETARDIVWHLYNDSDTPLEYHPFEEIILKQTPSLDHATPADKAKCYTILEVYVDNFCAMTNDTSLPNLRKLTQALITGIHSIFPPPHISGHHGPDPISEGKLDKGEGTWDYTKEILG